MPQFNNTNITLNNLVDIFGQIADTHGQINSFWQGNISELTQTVEQFPMLWVDLKPASFKRAIIEYNFRVYVMDMVITDLVNLLKVQSNAVQILWDIVKILRDVYDLEPSLDLNINYFDQAGSDSAGGAYGDFKIRVPQNYGACDVPVKTLIDCNGQ